MIDGGPLDPAAPLVVAAVADLARRLGEPVASIDVVRARAVTWGDRSYGCPQPGVHHIQRPVDGALVVLEVHGHRYEYHGGDPLELCEHPAGPGTREGRPRSV